MVSRTIKAITSKISGLGEAAFWLSLFSLFSQILALLRDRLLAYHFGAGHELDIYYAAFKIPDIIFVTVASIVSISALVPLFAKKETEGEKNLKEATSSIFTVFSLMIITASVISFVLMPKIVSLAFAGFSAESLQDTIYLSRLLLLSPFLLGFSNFFGSIVQYEKRFILYSLSPILYNIGIILGIVLLVGNQGIKSAAIGVIIGAFLHLALQAVFVIFSPYRPRFTFSINWKVVLETMKLSVPRTFAIGISSFTALFFAALASRLGEGSVAVFNLSWNLQSVPLSLIGVSFSLAAFPALSALAVQNNHSEVSARIARGVKDIIFWSIPLMFMIIVLRAHIVRLVLGSGLFDWSATRLVAASLAVFVISSLFQSIQIFLTRSHYALGKTRWPFLANLLGSVVSILVATISYLNYDKIFYFLSLVSSFFKVGDMYFGVLIIPLSFGIGCFVSVAMLCLGLGHTYLSKIFKEQIGTDQIIISSLLGAAFSYFCLSITSSIFDLDTFLGVLGHAAVAGFVGIAAWSFSLYSMGNAEIRDFLFVLKEKIKQSKE